MDPVISGLASRSLSRAASPSPASAQADSTLADRAGPRAQVSEPLAPAQVVRAAGRVSPRVLLHVLQQADAQVDRAAYGCGAGLSGPMLGALLLACRDLRRDPGADPSVRETLDGRLRQWKGISPENYDFEGVTPGQVLEGAPFRLVGTHVLAVVPEEAPAVGLAEKAREGAAWGPASLLEQAGRSEVAAAWPELTGMTARLRERGWLKSQAEPLEKLYRRMLNALPERATPEFLATELVPMTRLGACTDVVLAHYGLDTALELALAAPPEARTPQLAVLAGHVRDSGEKLRPDHVDGLVDGLLEAARKGLDNARDFDRCAELLAGALPGGSVGLEQRERVQRGLLAMKEQVGSSTLAEPLHRLAAGHPELERHLLEDLSNPMAQALLLKSPLDDREWAKLGAAVAANPADYLKFFFAREDLARRLAALLPEQAAASLEQRVEEAARAVSDKGSRAALAKQAPFVLFQRYLRGCEPGAFPQLHALKDYEAERFHPYLTGAAGHGRLPEALQEVEDTLQACSKLGLCHETLAGKLCQMTGPDRSLSEMLARLPLAEARLPEKYNLRDNALAAMQVLGRGTREQMERRLDWFSRLCQGLPPQGAAASPSNYAEKLGKLLPDERAVEAFERLVLTLEPTPEQALQAFPLVAEDPVARLPRLFRMARAAQGLERCLTVLPAVEEHLRQAPDDLERVAGGLARFAPYVPPEKLEGLTRTFLSALRGGASLEAALETTMRGQALGPAPDRPAAVVAKDGFVQVGGSRLKMRNPSPAAQ